VTGKKKRTGRILGEKRSWKKAVVTLAPGSRIEIYEGV
jgi:large subunit ribosomal protein L23